jgi:hypothetical protein
MSDGDPQVLKAIQVEPLGGGAYRVSGGAAPHVVQLGQDVARCDCADFAYRRHACKHLRAVLDALVLGRFTAQAGPGLERDVPPPDAEEEAA